MPGFTTRPVITGRRGVVTSGHYLASAAGFRIMEQGGNAFDAAAAAGFCLNLLEPHQNGLGGEVPTLIYSATERRPYAVSGMGWSPKGFSIDWCRENGIDLIPGDGYLPACVPAVVGTWALILARFGTMSFSQVLAPAIELAEAGFPLYDDLRAHIVANQAKYSELYPSTGEVYLPGGRPPEVSELLRNPAFAATLRTMCQAEAAAGHRGRVAGIEAARDAFYRGAIAEHVVRFVTDNPVRDASGREHAGLLAYEDMAEWQAGLETPIGLDFMGLRVHKCPAWTQGPVFVQQLSLLSGFDLQAMGHNSPQYLHTLAEVAKLAFADREAYYGDPLFDQVPLDTLLSDEYAARRRGQIGSAASLELRPGDAGDGLPAYATFDVLADNRRGMALAGCRRATTAASHHGDTTHLDVVDREGNMVSATPSGGWIGTSPVIRGLGFPLGTRGQMFYLDPARPNALAPRKRPRATLTPSLVTLDAAPYMVFGTPGGDAQDQWTLQFFLNYAVFGMGLQEALDAPTVHSAHFPSSFYPRDAYPGRLFAEERIAPETIAELRHRGHEVLLSPGWSHGKTMAIRYDGERGVISGAVAPKGVIGYAIGW